MADQEEFSIKFSGDFSEINAKIEELKLKLSNLKFEMGQELTEAVEEPIKTGISNATAAIGPLIAMGVVSAGKLLGDALNKSLQAALPNIKQFDILATHLERMGSAMGRKEIEDFINRLELASGISSSQLIPAFLELLSLTNSVQKAMSLLSIATDMSSTGLVSVSQASKALAQAYEGRTSGIRSLATALGIEKAQYMEINELLSLLTSKYSGFSKDVMGGLSGAFIEHEISTKQLRQAWGELIATSEAQVIPTFTNIQTSLTNIIEKFKESEEPLAKFGKGLLGLVGIGSQVFESFGGIIESLGTLIQTALLFKIAFGGVKIAGASLEAGAVATGGLGALGGLGLVGLAGAGIIGAMYAAGVGEKEAEQMQKSLAGVSDILTYNTIEIKEQGETIKKSVEDIEKIRGAYREIYEIQREGQRISKESSSDYSDVGVKIKEIEKVSSEVVKNERIINDEVSTQIQLAYQLVGLRGEERERKRIILSYTQRIQEAEREGRLEEAKQLRAIMTDELAMYDEQVAERKRREDEALQKRAQAIRDEVILSKLGTEEAIQYKIKREIEANMDLVKAGKLTYDELAEYAKLKYTQVVQSWARAELIGPSSPFMRELTGLSFTRRYRVDVNVNLTGAVAQGGLSRQDAYNIGNAIVNKMNAKGVVFQ